MNSFWQDTKFGARTLTRNPGFAAVAVLTLALGIGANTTIFTVVNSILLRPLPYKDPDRLVAVWHTDEEDPGILMSVSVTTFLDWQDQNQVFDSMAAHAHHSVTLTGQDEADRLRASLVSTELFPLLGIEPMVGRAFLPEEGRPGRNQVVILSHGLWQRVLGGDPEAVGRNFRLDDQNYTVVGVMPPTFHFPSNSTMLWIPWVPEEDRFYGARTWVPGQFTVVARVKKDLSLEQAQTKMTQKAQQLAEAFPKHYKGTGVRLRGLHEQTVRPIRQSLLVLWGAVGFVLLIACANVANLLLSRNVAREREFAIRVSLGAGRRRLVQQLLSESALLALPSGVLGLGVAYLGMKVLLAFRPPTFTLFSQLDRVSLDTTVLGFMLGVSLLTGVLFGLLPALQSSRPNLIQSLKQSGDRYGGGRNRMRNSLVIGEIALALVLLMGAGLMMRSFLLLQRVDPGFDIDNLLSLQVELPRHRYPQPHQQREFYDQLLERVEGLPGVQAAAATSRGPLLAGGVAPMMAITPGEQPPTERKDWHYIDAVYITPNYFSTVGIPLVRGRSFTDRDTKDAPPVVILDENLARKYWPDQDPVGQFLVTDSDSTPHRIVGMVKAARYGTLDQGTMPIIYAPYGRKRTYLRMLVVRARSQPMNLVPGIKSQVWALDKDIPIERIVTMEQQLTLLLGDDRFYLLLFGVFAVLAAAIATVGIYGVMAYAVNQRTHEIGVRMALGANRGGILRLVLAQGLRLTVIGICIGAGAAYWLGRFMEKFLFQVTPSDPWTLLSVSLLLASAAMLACYLPARRATQVDPMTALRTE